MAGASTNNELGVEARLTSSLVDILRGKPDLGHIAGVRRSHSVLRARSPFISNVNSEFSWLRRSPSADPDVHFGYQRGPEPYQMWLSHDVECAIRNGRGWLPDDCRSTQDPHDTTCDTRSDVSCANLLHLRQGSLFAGAHAIGRNAPQGLHGGVVFVRRFCARDVHNVEFLPSPFRSRSSLPFRKIDAH